MSVSAKCGDCGAAYANVPAKFAGKSIRCKKCGATVKVPKAAKADAAETDPWDLGDDLEMEAPVAAPRRSAPGRATAAPKAKPRKSGGIPKWVWLAGGGAGVCVLGCLGLFAVLAIGYPAFARESVLKSEAAAAEQAIAVMEELAAALAGVTDAASVQAAADKIRGPLAERMERLGVQLKAIDERRSHLPISQKDAIEAGEKEIEAKLKARGEETKRKVLSESMRLRTLPPEARNAIGNAMTEFGRRVTAAMPSGNRSGGNLFR